MQSQAPPPRPRARDLGIAPGVMEPGALNAITDVAGVEVGHTTLIRGEGKLVVGHGPVRTGVTAILPRGKASLAPVFAAWFPLNGNGELTGAAWIDESGLLEGPLTITNTHSVGVVRDAVVPMAAFAAATERSAAAMSGRRCSSVDGTPSGTDGVTGVQVASTGTLKFAGATPTSTAIACSSASRERCRTTRSARTLPHSVRTTTAPSSRSNAVTAVSSWIRTPSRSAAAASPQTRRPGSTSPTVGSNTPER